MIPVTKMWYDFLSDGKLMGLKCQSCGQVHFPPYPICRECSSTDMEWVEVNPEGTVRSLALVTAPDQWFAEWAPYFYAEATLDDGSNFDSMVFGFEDFEPEDVYELFKNAETTKVRLEIQERDGYSFPVYRYVAQSTI